MPDFLPIPPDLAWPFALAIAWIAGEFGHRWTGLPRICIYGLVGFLLANTQVGLLSRSDSVSIMLLANIAFGLILFELGYRINLRWLRNNLWLGITSLVEAGGTFAAVYVVAQWFGMLFISSPAVVVARHGYFTPAGQFIFIIGRERKPRRFSERRMFGFCWPNARTELCFTYCTAAHR